MLTEQRQGGFTLLEVVMVTAILVSSILVVVQLFLRSNQAQELAIQLNRTTVINQSLLQGMRVELGSSVRLFQNDALGNAYLASLSPVGVRPPITCNLPTIDPNGIFRQEATTGSMTGNTLLFANHSWTDEFECLSTNRYSVEVFRLTRYYLSEEDGGPQPGTPIGLNLCRWVSEPMADGTQIDDITDPTDRAEILEHLRTATPDVNGETHTVIELVWRLGDDPAVLDTFRQIDVGGTLSSVPLAPRTSPWRVARDPRLSSDDLLHYRHLSVATNYAHSAAGVGLFSVMDNTGDGFPHGFEVQIIGPSAGRQVLLQLSIASTRRGGLPAVSSQKVVVSTRDT